MRKDAQFFRRDAELEREFWLTSCQLNMNQNPRKQKTAALQAHAFLCMSETALAIGVWFLGDSPGIVERKKFGVFDDTLLKTKRFAAGRISRCRRWLTQQGAEIIEVLLVSGRFLSRISVPLPFELCRGH